jgi:amino acid transporter
MMARKGGLPVTYKGLRSGTIGLAGNVVIAVSAVAPAYSLAATLGAVVAVAGAKTPALWIIGFIPMMLIAFAFRELANVTPDCGSTFTWVTRAFGPWVGWLAGWALVIASMVAIGNSAQLAAMYFLDALHVNKLLELAGFHLGNVSQSLPVQITVGGVAVVILIVLCLRGIDATERTQAMLLALQLAMLLLVSVVALVKVFNHHAGPQAVTPEWGWLSPTGLSASAIANGSILCVFAYWGWDTGLSVAEETKSPRKNPGRAAVLATIVVLGTYVLVSVAIQAFAGFGDKGIGLNNPANANDTLSILGDPVVGKGLAVVLLLAISSSSLASVVSCLAPTARTTLAMAVYRALPQRFARVNPRYQTPWFGTVVIGVAGFAIYVVMTLLSRNSVPDMVSSLGLVIAFYYAMTAYACVWTYRRTLLRSARDFWLRGALPLIGAVVMTWAFIKSAVDMYAPDYGQTHIGPVGGVFIMGIGMLLIGIPLAALCTITGRGFFSGRTLNSSTQITVLDVGSPAVVSVAGSGRK